MNPIDLYCREYQHLMSENKPSMLRRTEPKCVRKSTIEGRTEYNIRTNTLRSRFHFVRNLFVYRSPRHEKISFIIWDTNNRSLDIWCQICILYFFDIDDCLRFHVIGHGGGEFIPCFFICKHCFRFSGCSGALEIVERILWNDDLD